MTLLNPMSPPQINAEHVLIPGDADLFDGNAFRCNDD